MSQSIRSDHISESTIARIAGKVKWAVGMARLISAEVQRTKEPQALGVAQSASSVVAEELPAKTE